jgi:hypothetical protein
MAAEPTLCDVTHPLLREGVCPWCECPVRAGAPSERTWDLAAVAQALGSDDRDARLWTLTALMMHFPKTGEAIPVWGKALRDPDADCRMLAVNALTLCAGPHSAEEVEGLEKELQQAPDNAVVRILLLNYHGRRGSLFEGSRREHERHLFWLIEKAPQLLVGNAYDSFDPATPGEGYEEAKRLWLGQLAVHENDVTVLRNAAAFFTHCDTDLSEGILKKARGLESESPEWPERLGALYARRAQQGPPEQRRAMAQQALAELQRALAAVSDEHGRFLRLPEVARAAFEAGELQQAHDYATELLGKTQKRNYHFWQEPYAVHVGNVVLGRLALRARRVAEATAYLLEAGKTRGSPIHRTGGPNMMLAQELLNLGERGAVVEYLKLCANFWQTPDHQAEQWIYALEHGGTPDFGPNLYY